MCIRDRSKSDYLPSCRRNVLTLDCQTRRRQNWRIARNPDVCTTVFLFCVDYPRPLQDRSHDFEVFARAFAAIRKRSHLQCVPMCVRSTSKSSTVNIIGSAAAYTTDTPRHTALASAKRVLTDGWQKQRGESSAGQETSYNSIHNEGTQISRNRREKIALSMG